MDNVPAVPDPLLAAILDDIASGMTLRTVAEKHGISKTSLHRRLMSEAPDEYRGKLEQSLIARVVEADDALEEATDFFALGKWRELARNRRLDLSRLVSRFSDKQQINSTITYEAVSVQEAARRIAFLLEQSRQVIDITPEPTAAPMLDSPASVESEAREAIKRGEIQAARDEMVDRVEREQTAATKPTRNEKFY